MTAPLSQALLRRARPASLPTAVVLGTNITGLTVARSLRRLGAVVVGVDRTRRFPTGHSSAWHEVAVLPRFDHPELIDWLDEAAAAIGHQPVLIACTDEQVKLVAAEGARVRERYRCELASHEATMLLMDKRAFATRAAAAGWPVPRTWAVGSESALRELAGQLPYPVILKPQVKNRGFREVAPAKAFRCRTPDEVFDAYASFAAEEPDVILQEWIEGPDHAVRFSFHYLTAEGEELSRFEGHKLRQWLPQCGSSASATRCADEVVAPLSLEILRACGAVGLCSVEYKYDARTGRHVITEPTIGRPNLQLGAAVINGVDPVAVAYAHLAGQPLPRPRIVPRHATWVIVPSDLRAARHYVARGELTWFGWLRSFSWPVVPAVWRLDDVGIVIAHAMRIARFLRRRVARLIPRSRAEPRLPA